MKCCVHNHHLGLSSVLGLGLRVRTQLRKWVALLVCGLRGNAKTHMWRCLSLFTFRSIWMVDVIPRVWECLYIASRQIPALCQKHLRIHFWVWRECVVRHTSLFLVCQVLGDDGLCARTSGHKRIHSNPAIRFLVWLRVDYVWSMWKRFNVSLSVLACVVSSSICRHKTNSSERNSKTANSQLIIKNVWFHNN